MSPIFLRTGMAALLLPLTACVNMSGLGGDSKYACAAPEGVACDSVSGTYANAVHRNLPSQRRAEAAPAMATASTPSPSGSANESAPPRRTLETAASSSAPQTLRSQARYLRLWVKPWEDIDGDLFDQAHVYVQIDQGRWQIDHVRQQIRERYAPLRPPVSAGPAPQSNAEAGPDTVTADRADTAGPIQRTTATDPRQLFPSLVAPPTGPGARPQ
ncbi:TraV family lipoprotein [Xenophilus azovorans]|uniref:TraV family lipoprotein n=1 Tax=Xenophilus azovorans TaxID=151755 RepID=UPI000570EEA9|nr:TraV family lipoprotein [Xenophilus azovorans]